MPLPGSVRKWVYFAMVGVLITSVVAWWFTRDRLPPEIRIATAAQGGLYHHVGTLLGDEISRRTGRPVRLISTNGSIENRELLLKGGVDLAILQASAASMQKLAVIAPLYREICHVIVRRDSGIESVRDLSGRAVVIGPEGSGMRESALQVLQHYRIDVSKLKETGRYFLDLMKDPKLEAAIVTTGMNNPDLVELLACDKFTLLPIMDAEALAVRFGFFYPANVPRGIYMEGPTVPPDPVPTVATTAFLAAGENASPLLITETLAALYETDLNLALPTLISARDARDVPLPRLHSAARNYHDPYEGLGLLSNAMQSLAAIKELLISLCAGLYLIWERQNRIREAREKEEVRRQKEHLDSFLSETVRIEKAQMTIDEPARLREMLDEVTRIKLRALEELTHEDLRGDRLFSIFLMQCSNLIRKIQSKIILSAQISTNLALRQSARDDEVVE
ncbi:MAG TPA: TAXI family TRAP transporter solute-binding subunit [Planctomycetota bacterium]|nr:TAXI family TRAP transporter solute-binding subunit [Planctomycetota bacterium]